MCGILLNTLKLKMNFFECYMLYISNIIFFIHMTILKTCAQINKYIWSMNINIYNYKIGFIKLLLKLNYFCSKSTIIIGNPVLDASFGRTEPMAT